MIVITKIINRTQFCYPGDTFKLSITDNLGFTVSIEEKITVKKKIDFVASFRFALEDGTCPGFHLAGIFANKAELPAEFDNAVLLNDLSTIQKQNFRKSVCYEEK